MVRGAFEVGHALQDNRNERLLNYRYQLLQLAAAGERFGIVGVLLSPIIAAFSLQLGGVLLFAGVVSLFSGIATQLLVVPIEWEAGFSIALPLLTKGAYIAPQDGAAVRLLFLACALSRLAHALADIIDGRHWLRVIGLWRPSRS